MEKLINCVAYLRISTDMQDINAQKTSIYEYAKQKKYIIIKEFSDEDVSGSIPLLQRKTVKEMLEFCKNNNIEIILVYDLTRLGRYDPLDLLNDIKKIQVEYGIIFEFVNEPEIKDPMFEKLWNFIKSWYSEFERLQISKRTKYGLLKLKQQGKLYHRPSLLHYYASTIFNKNLNEITKEDLDNARQILQQYINSYLMKGVKKTIIPKMLIENELKPVFMRFPKAHKSVMSIYQFLKREKLI